MKNYLEKNTDVKEFMYSCIELEKNGGEDIIETLLTDTALALLKAFKEKYGSERIGVKGKDPNPANWSDSDIDEVVARVRNGEKITL